MLLSTYLHRACTVAALILVVVLDLPVENVAFVLSFSTTAQTFTRTAVCSPLSASAAAERNDFVTNGARSNTSSIPLSRRSALKGVFTAVCVAVTSSAFGTPAAPALASDELLSSSSSSTTPERDALLSAIASSGKDEDVMQALQKLVEQDPSKGRAATLSDQLEGQWRLLWSAKAEAFSPLLQLPGPLKPSSYQYLGKAATQEVGGPGERVAQGLTGGILGTNQLWLSSGVAPATEDASVLDILPPFRFQLGGRYGTGREKRTIVESGSDAEFRKNAINSRSEEAQRAPGNKYRQLYLEGGGPGSLRISTITSGDPVIVGAIFVHEKL